MIGFADEWVFEFGFLFVVGFDYGVEHEAICLELTLWSASTFLRFDDLAECNGSAHRAVFVFDLAFDFELTQSFPATDDTSSIIHFELIIVVG